MDIATICPAASVTCGSGQPQKDGNAALEDNYTIPFFVWGLGVAAGKEIYALNASSRLDPGSGRPDYNASMAPIRNGDSGNLALDLLGLGPIPGSTINFDQSLSVTVVPAPRGFFPALIMLGMISIWWAVKSWRSLRRPTT